MVYPLLLLYCTQLRTAIIADVLLLVSKHLDILSIKAKMQRKLR